MTKDKIKEKMQDAIEKLEDCVDALRINMKRDVVNVDCVLCGAAAASAMINRIEALAEEYEEEELHDES